MSITEEKKKQITFIDLFAGIGGFRLALEAIGCKCVYSSEIDKHARKVYTDNFDDVPDGDITKVDADSLPDFDLLAAGFPCQPFSIAGKELGFADTRGTLFFDVARVVKAKRPKAVFLENVKNLVKHNNGKTLAVIEKTMTELGYTFDYAVLNAADFNVPQVRERIYIVCFRNDIDPADFTFPKPVPLTKHVEDILLPDSEIDPKMYTDRTDIQYNGKPDTAYSSSSIRLGQIEKGRQGERFYSVKGSAVTLSSGGGGFWSRTGGYQINGKIRKLCPRECARLMGFPDSYKLSKSDNQAYKQLGNSVVVDVIRLIGEKILEVLETKSKN